MEASAIRGGGVRSADPWRDTDVIDERAPRFNQAVVGTVALLGAIFGWPLAWALMGAQLFIGLTLGRRFCITCVAYFVLVQPRFGEGELEDSRPPRLANAIGTVFLGGAAAAWWLGAPVVGTVLAAIVAALALIAAGTGLCAGCELYRVTARVRGISPRHHARLDPSDFGLGDSAGAYVEFSHPLCGECRQWERRLRDGGAGRHDRRPRAAGPRAQVRSRRGADRRPRKRRRRRAGAARPLAQARRALGAGLVPADMRAPTVITSAATSAR